MQRQEHLIERLRKQREMLDQLITEISQAPHLDGVSRAYDSTTKQIQKNLLSLRRSFITKANKTRRK